MTRPLMASVLALSIAMTSMTALPARAGNNDNFGNFLAGAIAAIIISKALEQNQAATRRRNPPIQVTPPPRPRPRPPVYKIRGILPSDCFFTKRTSKGRRGLYGATCLNETMRRPERLPRACRTSVSIRGGRRASVYDAKCLQNRGFRDEAWLR
jgi:hypothetical protein